MGMATGDFAFDFSEISFFELDRLFAQSARALRRKQQRRRRREKAGGGSSPSRSRTPPTKRLVLRGARNAPGFGGFTGSVEKVEKTVVVSGVPASADEKTIFGHFSKCGTVCDVRIVRNRHNVPTGTVIVEFQEDEAVAKACSLPQPHNEIMGVAVLTKRADAQINKSTGNQPKRMMTRQQFTQQVLSGLKTGETSGPHMRKLHIKNLRPVVTEEDMRGIFKPFGEFEEFEWGEQECWITFQNASDAQEAKSSMQGFQLVGLELQIAIISAGGAAIAPPSSMVSASPEKNDGIDFKTDSDFGATGSALNPAQNRIELMKKLLTSHSQHGVPTVAGQGPARPSASGSASPTPLASSAPPAPKAGSSFSRTLLLQNMFTPSAVNLQQDPRFYEEIREDTHDECAKFGKVLHVTVDPRGSTGLIYVMYETPQQRMAAEAALNGRWFESKKIVAVGIDDSIWQDLAAQATSTAS